MPRQRQVRQMRRVKAAAEHADPARCIQAVLLGKHQPVANQSRGRKKSLYSRASAVPSAGFQS